MRETLAVDRVRRPSWLGELAVVLGLLVVYDQVAGLARVRPDTAIAHGRTMLALTPGDGLELRLDKALDGVGWLHAPAAYWYDLAHIDVTLAVLIGCYVWRVGAFRRARRALVTINLIGLAVFLLYPVAPPRLLPGAGFVDVVAESHTFGSYESVQAGSHKANEFGSVPSLHAAWALWVLLTVWSVTPRPLWRALAVAHVVITCVVVVATGNHYVVDVLFGFLTCAAGWVLSGLRRRSSQPELQPVA